MAWASLLNSMCRLAREASLGWWRFLDQTLGMHTAHTNTRTISSHSQARRSYHCKQERKVQLTMCRSGQEVLQQKGACGEKAHNPVEEWQELLPLRY